MKILPLFFNNKTQPVIISRSIEESYVVTDALNRLYPVEPMLKSFAKANGVDLFVSADPKIHELKPSERIDIDNIILLTVSDSKTAKSNTAKFAINYGNDKYSFTEVKPAVYENASGERKEVNIIRSYEDSFIRAFFRTFENLTKQVKNQD